MNLADQWWWLIAGMILMIAEMIAPGIFLVWIGGAAIVTGLIELASGVSLPLQFAIFAIVAVGAVYGASHWISRVADDPDPLLNDRVARLVGEVVTVTTAISGGRGRVAVGDGEWSARGPDAPVGARVRIIGGSDGQLLVEAA